MSSSASAGRRRLGAWRTSSSRPPADARNAAVAASPFRRKSCVSASGFPNPFADGEMTIWFHVTCGMYRRPESFLEALEATERTLDNAEWLREQAKHGAGHRRLPRLNGAERAPTGRARCRSCKDPIEKGAWRSPLVFHEDGRFQASGFVHIRCFRDYFETTEVEKRIPALLAGADRRGSRRDPLRAAGVEGREGDHERTRHGSHVPPEPRGGAGAVQERQQHRHREEAARPPDEGA